jgi:hypothetical protein
MAAILTEEEFSKYLNTKFRAGFDGKAEVDLELTEVKGYVGKAIEPKGMERFSLFFKGELSAPELSQKVYSFQHDQMGEFDIFIVPIARDDKGFRYQAVFNYFKSQDSEG